MSDNYCIRKIDYNDYFKEYMYLINVFTRYPEKQSYEEFCIVLDKIKSHNAHIFVIEHNSKIISSIKCLIEQKIHNNFKCVLHIEDLVTHKDYRRQGLASKLIKFALDFAREQNCYKVILCSNPENCQFYLNTGFIQKGVEFTKYII